MTKRREFSKAEKRKMVLRSAGVCERHRWRPGEVCTKPAKQFDHLRPDGEGGDPVAENGAHLCIPCHREKTTTEDVPRMAKADAQRDAHQGVARKKVKIPQRPKAPKSAPDKLPLLPPRQLYA